MIFNEETQRCEDAENAECDHSTVSPPGSESNPCWGVPDFLLAADLNNCAEYHICYENQIINSLVCPDGQVFDAKTQVCGDFVCTF